MRSRTNIDKIVSNSTSREDRGHIKVTHSPERRKEARHRVLKGGKVFYNNYAISFDCTIRNESPDGMQIRMDPTLAVPSHISLLNRKDGTMADAKIVWQRAGVMGLKFESKMQDVLSFSTADIRRMSIIATRG